MIEVELIKKVKANLTNKQIEKIVKVVASECKLKTTYRVSLVMVGQSKIRKLNLQYRNLDKVTDVLSFRSLDKDFVSPIKDNYLGESIICYGQVLRQAKADKVQATQELTLVIVHSLLHLLGYDHERSGFKEAKKMDKFQRKIMAKLGFDVDLMYN